MQIFEITAKKITQEAINPGAVIGALGDRLDAYNFAQAGLTRPGASGNPYGNMRAKAAAAADPLINQMAADELANWNQLLNNAMKSTGAKSLAALPIRTKISLSDSFTNRVYSYFLDGQLGNDVTQFPKMVDIKSQAEANTLLSELQQAMRAIRNYNSPASTPEGQFQQWRNLSKITYDMRSLIQFNPVNRPAAAPQKMPVIVVGPGPTGSVRIGNTTLNSATLHSGVAKVIRSFMPSATSPEPVVSVDGAGNVRVNGTRLNGAADPVQDELIKIITAEIKKLNP
jgi:hypothetical protein